VRQAAWLRQRRPGRQRGRAATGEAQRSARSMASPAQTRQSLARNSHVRENGTSSRISSGLAVISLSGPVRRSGGGGNAFEDDDWKPGRCSSRIRRHRRRSCRRAGRAPRPPSRRRGRKGSAPSSTVNRRVGPQVMEPGRMPRSARLEAITKTRPRSSAAYPSGRSPAALFAPRRGSGRNRERRLTDNAVIGAELADDALVIGQELLIRRYGWHDTSRVSRRN